MEAELKRGDHAEVAAAASQRPEQVGVLILGRAQQLAVGRHDVDRKQIVDGEAVLAHQPADATTEREPGDAGVTHDSAGGGQTVRLRLVIDVAPQRTTLHPGPAVGGIDSHAPHRREVDDDPVVANGGAGHVVASTPYGDLQIVVAGETYGRDHVGGPDASGDQARAPVDGAVPDCTGAVVVGVLGADHPASESVDLRDGWRLGRVAAQLGLAGRPRVAGGSHAQPRCSRDKRQYFSACGHRASSSLDGHIEPPRTPPEKSKIWTSHVDGDGPS